MARFEHRLMRAERHDANGVQDRYPRDLDGVGSMPGTSDGHRLAAVDRSKPRAGLWHAIVYLSPFPLAYASYRFGSDWPQWVVEVLRTLPLILVALLAGALTFGRFLRNTKGVAGARRKAVADFFGAPGSDEPEASRRLWCWQCSLYVLLVPAGYFLNSTPAISLGALLALGGGRCLMARARREDGGSPHRVGIIPLVIYIGLLLVALVATVLRATGS